MPDKHCLPESEIVGKTRAIVRKIRSLAYPGWGTSAVGCEVLVAALAKALGPDRAGEMLRGAGIENIEKFLAHIPDASVKEKDNLPAAMPDKHLEALLRSELAPFFQGETQGEDALRVLLKPVNMTPVVQQLLKDPQTVLGNCSGDESPTSTRQLLRALSAFYQGRYHLGWLYHRANAKAGLSDFASGKEDEAFFEAVDTLYAEEASARRGIFESPIYLASPLGTVRERHGEEAAHIAAAATLAEIGQVGDGPLMVVEMCWTMEPKYFHRAIAPVKARICQLRQAGVLEVVPDHDELRLFDRVLGSRQLVDDFVNHLHDADAWTECETHDLLRQIP